MIRKKGKESIEFPLKDKITELNYSVLKFCYGFTPREISLATGIEEWNVLKQLKQLEAKKIINLMPGFVKVRISRVESPPRKPYNPKEHEGFPDDIFKSD